MGIIKNQARLNINTQQMLPCSHSDLNLTYEHL